MTAEEVMEIFSSLDLESGQELYLRNQARRLAYLRDLVQRYCDDYHGALRILDVGPHFLTRCLLETISPKPQMSTLGYEFPKLVPRNLIHQHATANLNECGSLALPFEPESFDIILICEVVEHLRIPPDVVLTFLKKLVKKPEGIIIVGTPNAACLSNRLRMMMGENPFQLLSADLGSGAGHIREYTMQELRKYGENAGLNVKFEEYCSYWRQHIQINNIEEIERDVPSYRTGLTIVYQSS
jgi:predicted SAM-dependent methyltransferase